MAASLEGWAMSLVGKDRDIQVFKVAYMYTIIDWPQGHIC